MGDDKTTEAVDKLIEYVEGPGMKLNFKHGSIPELTVVIEKGVKNIAIRTSDE